MNNILLLTLIFTFSIPALSNEKKDSSEFARELMVIGKMSGACGIFKLQIQFQENTGLDGGSKFVERFWRSEAAKLGMSLEEYATQCHDTLKKYTSYSKVFTAE
ncbi:hypothetical protein [Dasania marina]|uniref:hypothetical protein n=1 Tax=Dasania marina TaxID=471499 RepID=UPI00035E478E|nr:hypothetical protein [Dasania marina]